jgi:hypothetical protein
MINPITNLTIHPSESSLVIDWNASSSPGITHYSLIFSLDSFATSGNDSPNFSNSQHTLIDPNITSYRLDGLTDQTNYYIAITAETQTEKSPEVTASAKSGYISQKYGQVKYGRALYGKDLVPVAPTNVKVIKTGREKLLVTWENPKSGQIVDVDYCHVWRSKNSEPYDIIATLSSSSSSYQDTNIQPGNSYSYKITLLDWS